MCFRNGIHVVVPRLLALQPAHELEELVALVDPLILKEAQGDSHQGDVVLPTLIYVAFIVSSSLLISSSSPTL